MCNIDRIYNDAMNRRCAKKRNYSGEDDCEKDDDDSEKNKKYFKCSISNNNSSGGIFKKNIINTYFDPDTPPHVSNRVDNNVTTTTTSTSTTTSKTDTETKGSTTISKIVKITKNVSTTTEIITETTTTISKLHNFQSYNLLAFDLFQCCCYYFAEKPFLSPTIFKYIREYIVKTCHFSFLPDSEFDRFKQVANIELLTRLLSIQDVYIAGGSCVPNAPINDIDVYIHSMESYKECLNLCSKENVEKYNIRSGIVTITFTRADYVPIQLIYTHSEWELPIQETISRFNLDYCQVAIMLNNTDYNEPKFEWIKTPIASDAHYSKIIKCITKCPIKPKKFLNLLKKAYLKGYTLPEQVTCLAQLNLEWKKWSSVVIQEYSKEEFMAFELMGDLDYKNSNLFIDRKATLGHVSFRLLDILRIINNKERPFEPLYADYDNPIDNKIDFPFFKNPQYLYLGCKDDDTSPNNQSPKNIEYQIIQPVDIHKEAIIKLLVKAEIGIRLKKDKDGYNENLNPTLANIFTTINNMFVEWKIKDLQVLCKLLKQVLKGQFYIFEYLFELVCSLPKGIKIDFEYTAPKSFFQVVETIDVIFKKYDLFKEISFIYYQDPSNHLLF